MCKANGGRLFADLWLASLVHLVCLAVYLVPLFLPSTHQRGHAVLDEIHIMSSDNKDVNGETTIRNIFTNDYWGRPMSAPNSHRSWRPLTILSFRYLKGGTVMEPLTMHRVVNIITHACIAELVSILSVKLVTASNNPWISPDRRRHCRRWIRVLSKLAFALHPTHVEITANAANRGHLFGVLCAVLLSDPDLPWLVFPMALIAGFLSSETFLFQVVPAAVTLSAIHYIRFGQTQATDERKPFNLFRDDLRRLTMVLPRVLFLLFGALAYYWMRWYFDTLSIPDGLIRPAENPFFEFMGWHRVRNYLYVLAIHVAKAWDMDFVGFSHEYGRECIRPIDSWTDARLAIPLIIFVGYVLCGLVLLVKCMRTSLFTGIVYIVHLSWMVTLFPVSGVIKVGTFIADRIVVAASVSTSMLAAYAACYWISQSTNHNVTTPRSLPRSAKLMFLLFTLCFMIRRIYHRSVEWMDPLPLLESSLRTCPRFAKAHLEISKIYSGLYKDLLDLQRSRRHLELAEAIDPDYCDVHQQFAHVAAQQQDYLEFEDRLTKALICPFTLSGSIDLWHKYWNVMFDEVHNNAASVAAARNRYQAYMAVINDAIESEKHSTAGTSPHSSSPLIQWTKKSDL